MDRRTVLAVVAAALGAVMVVLAASSSPVRVWSDPPPGAPSNVEVTTSEVDTSLPPVASQQPGPGTNENPLLRVLAAITLVLLVWLAVVVISTWARMLRRIEWRRRREPTTFTTLPVIDPAEVVLDVAAARRRLAEGTPRNAIVACWLQLERDAAAAGLERDPAETSAEYTTRVVRGSSVDPGPIGELADLYREARFSRHELDDTHRERAVAALVRVAAALPQPAEPAP